jgi:hypothetical protein
MNASLSIYNKNKNKIMTVYTEHDHNHELTQQIQETSNYEVKFRH